MRSKAIFMALLALAFAAQGAPVSDATARFAAGSWALSDASLGVPHGISVSEARAYDVDGTNGFYAVSLEGGGTLFLSADDEIDPVLAFTAAADVDLSEKSPLRNLLGHDIVARRRKLAAEAKFAATSGGSSVAASSSRAKKLWSAFTGSSQASSGQSGGGRFFTASPRKSMAFSDMRVEPLLTTKWSQQRDKFSNLCYNYYTPNNYPCGCVATASGQILYYWKCPQGSLPKFSGDCIVDKVPTTLESHGDSRQYDWDAMAEVSSHTTSLKGRQAIGALLYDLGVAFKADYSDDGTGAYEMDVTGPLREHFGLASAYTYSSRNAKAYSLHHEATRQRAILANLDAKRPVELYIMSTAVGGHAVVADGYGYVNISGEDIEFTHINMGWAGTDDMWYNLPVLQTEEAGSQAGQSGGYTFEYLVAATFNIHPTETGDLLTGRIVDDDGLPIENASVAVYPHGSAASPVAVTNSNAHGIYSFTLPGGAKYDIVAVTPDGRKSGMLEGVLLKATTVSDTTTFLTSDANDIGNSWGNDIALLDPRARIVTGVVTNAYTTLDMAIADARDIAGLTGVTPEIEILRDISLNSDATIDFDCVIRAATGDESSTLVNLPSGAKLTVAAGVELYASNCVFEATEYAYPISVAAGGKVFVGPGFSGRVSTADADGFNVIGHVTSDIVVDCLSATVAGQVFGHATTDDFLALSNSVAQVYAAFDEERETRGTPKATGTPGVYDLVWEGIPLPPEFSAGYYVDKDGKTNAFGRVDKLFDMFNRTAAAGMLGSTREIVVVGYDEEGISSAGDFVVSTDVVLRGIAGARLKPAPNVHIVVGDGGSLVVKNVVIGDRVEADTFVKVQSGGLMTLGAGAVFTNIVCAANSPKRDPGPIAVEAGGTLRLEAGSEIVGCAAIGVGGTTTLGGGKNGGGVYVCKDGTLDLAGGHIRDCWTNKGFGGGVYAISGAKIVVSGPSIVAGNISNKDGSSKQEDIYFNSLTDKVSITNYVSGGSIGVRYASSSGTETNFVFATATSAAIAGASASAFFNDVNPMLVAGVTNETDLAWFVPEPPPLPVEDLVALLEVDGGATITNGSLQAAFARLADDADAASATLTVYSNSTFTADLVVPGGVDLRLKSANPVAVTKVGDCSIIVGEGASLVVSGIAFGDASEDPSKKPFFSVEGGYLEFLGGTEVSGLLFGDRYAAAVAVRDGEESGGTFVMHDGAVIAGCTNLYEWASDNTAYSAGLFVNGMSQLCVAHLDGGTITNCVARRTGGAYVGNKGKIYLSGDVTIDGNSSTTGGDANLSVAAGSGLVFDGPLTGSIGVRRDANADKVVFGIVSTNLYESASTSNVVASAMSFISDDGYGYGIAAGRGDGNMYLVWSENLDADGTYTPLSDPSVPFPVDPPSAAVGLVYNGLAQTGVVAHAGYDLSGVPVATNAGAYKAVATLSPGYVWSDGSDGEKTNEWSIAKGTLDMSLVVFEDKTVNWDGNRRSLNIEGTLPDGVTVSYSPANGLTPSAAPGAYEITAKFAVADSANYYPIPNRTATLTIVKTISQPSVLKGLVYNAAAQSGVAPDPSQYSLSGDVSGIDAGIEYTTVVTPNQFYVWGGGSTNALRLTWSIAKAQLTIVASNAWKRVGDKDPVFEYGVDGLQGDDTADEVLIGSLSRDPGEEKGKYPITQGTLSVKPGNTNYEISGLTTAYLTIADAGPGPEPEPPVEPLPVAFTAVADGSGTWTLTITTAVEKCWYSLYETNSLSGGFKIDDVAPAEIRQATAGDAPTMNFTRPANGSQLFWKVRAEQSDAH